MNAAYALTGAFELQRGLSAPTNVRPERSIGALAHARRATRPHAPDNRRHSRGVHEARRSARRRLAEPYALLRGRVAKIRIDTPGLTDPWLTVSLHDVRTSTELTIPRQPAHVSLARRGARVVAVSDFFDLELRTFLIRHGCEWGTIPPDVRKTMRRPLLADISVRLAKPGHRGTSTTFTTPCGNDSSRLANKPIIPPIQARCSRWLPIFAGYARTRRDPGARRVLFRSPIRARSSGLAPSQTARRHDVGSHARCLRWSARRDSRSDLHSLLEAQSCPPRVVCDTWRAGSPPGTGTK